MRGLKFLGGGFILLTFLLVSCAEPLSLDLALFGAFRTVGSRQIREVYGNGYAAAPFLGVRVLDGLSLALGYEFGYCRSGEIGLYKEKTDLSVRGWEVFALWKILDRRWAPYIKAGLAGLSYRQTIESSFPLFLQAKGRKTSLLFGAGVRAKLAAGLFGFIEAHYIPLKVKPFDIEVDLGGWRFGLGLGTSFHL